MKTLKKSLVLVLAFMMAVSVFAFGANAAFTDANEITPEYKEAVDVLSGLGLVAGIGDGTLAPKANIERAQLAKILYEAYTGKDYTKAASYAGLGTFKDVNGNAWYAGVVNYAAYKGWIKGYGDGKFGPTDNVTGYDALTMVLRMLGYGKLNEFASDTYRANALELATKLDMVKNTDDNDVNYAVIGTREEVFEYLFNAMKKIPQVKATGDALVYIDDADFGGKTLLEKKGYTDASVKGQVVEAVPATDASLTTEEGYKINIGGTEYNTADNYAADLVGKTVDATINDTEKDGKVVYGVNVVSVEITTKENAKDKTKVDYYLNGTKLDSKNVTVTGAKKLAAGALTDNVFTATDIVKDTTYYATVADGKYTIYLVVDDAVSYEIVKVKVATNDDGDKTYEVNGADKDLDGTNGLKDLKVGIYAMSKTTNGDVENYAVLKTVDVTVSSQKTVSGKNYIVAGGTQYEIGAIAADEEVTAVNGTASAENGKEFTLVELNGKYYVAAKGNFTETPADIKTVDGFAQVLAIEYKLTPGEDENNSILGGTEASAPVINAAKAQLLKADGTVVTVDLKAEVKTKNKVSTLTIWKNADEELVTGNYAAVSANGTENKDGTVTVVNDTLNGKVVAYNNNSKTTFIYDDLDTVNVEDVVVYTVNEAPATIAKNATTADGVIITNAKFVSTETEDGETVYKAYKGTGSFDSFTTSAIVTKTTGKGDDAKTTVEAIFGTATPIAAADTDTVVYVNKDDVEDLSTEEETLLRYTAYVQDGTTVTIDVDEAIADTGFYVLKADNTLGAKKDTVVTAADIKLNGDYVTIAGDNFNIANAKVIAVAGDLADGATIGYILDKDNDHAIVALWVTAVAE